MMDTHFSIVEIASWVIVSSALGRLFNSFSNSAQATAVEERAAYLEYKDEETSEERRNQLRMRYPKTLVSDPRDRFFLEARKEVAESRRFDLSERKQWAKDIGKAILLWVFVAPLILIVFRWAFASARLHPGIAYDILAPISAVTLSLVTSSPLGGVCAAMGLIYVTAGVIRFRRESN